MHVDREGRGVARPSLLPDRARPHQGLHQALRQGLPQPLPLPPAAGRRPGRRRRGLGRCARSSTSRGRGRSYGWPCYEGTFRTSGYKDMAGCAAQYDAGPTAHDPPSYEYAQAPGRRDDRGRAALRGRAVPGPVPGRLVLRRLLEGPDLADDHRRSGQGRRADPVRHRLRRRRRPRARAQRRPRLRELRRRRGHGLRPADRLRQPRAAPRRLRHPGTGHRAARRDPERRGHGRPGRGGDDLRMGSRQRRVRGRDRPVGPPHLCRRGARGHAHRPRRARPRGERYGRDPRQRDPADRDPARTAAGSFRYGEPIELKGAATDVQDGELGDAALHWRISIHHGQHTHVVEADRTGARDHVHPAGRPRRRLRARAPPHGARLRRPRGHRDRDAAARDDRPAPRELAARGCTRLCGDRRDRAHPAEGGDRLPPDRVGACRVRARWAALHFDHWSDGGERLHEIDIPDAELTLTAVYAPAPDPEPRRPIPSPRRRRPPPLRRRRLHRPHLGSRSTPRQAGIPRGGSAAASPEGPGRCASTSRCGCGAPPRAAAGGGASSGGSAPSRAAATAPCG